MNRKLLSVYKNGNATVSIYKDGTRVIFSRDNELDLDKPLNIDLKVSNKCKYGCAQCHEDSNQDGAYCAIEDLSFLKTMQEGAECAIGGGALTEYPYLDDVLSFIKNECHLYANCTFNYSEIVEHYDRIKAMQDGGLIHGIGISVSVPIPCLTDDLAIKINSLSNVVLHVINGLFTEEHALWIKEHIDNPKVLILGYKSFRRGELFYSTYEDTIKDNQDWLYKNLFTMKINEYYDTICFDNLAIEQLEPYRLITDPEWKQLYQGKDGTSTMYIDAVKKEFATNSISKKRYKLLDNIQDMFAVVKQEVEDVKLL